MSFEYVIDSSAWMEYIGGTSKGDKIIKIIEESQIATSIVAIAELADKFEQMNKPFADHLNFIRSRAKLMPIDPAIALHAAKLKKEFRKYSTKFSLADGIHLATAMGNNAILVTADSDFEKADKILLI